MMNCRPSMPRTVTVLLSGALALAAAPLLAAMPTAVAAPTPGGQVCTETTCTIGFDYAGEPETWRVPAGVTSARFELVGARGGISYRGVAGGSGALVAATLTVEPHTEFTIRVGGHGHDATIEDIDLDDPKDNPGGWNGGGAAYANWAGGSGGGATDVRRGGDTLAHRVLVAGAGGGGAVTLGTGSIPIGGDAGEAGQAGGTTINGIDVMNPGQGGAPGTDTAPGVGGAGGLFEDNRPGPADCELYPDYGDGPGEPGAPGTFGGGGYSFGGGGGGGGWFGGGGGGQGAQAHCAEGTYYGGAGGGGGGSSYVEPGATDVEIGTAPPPEARVATPATGHGAVLISYPNPVSVEDLTANTTEARPYLSPTGALTDLGVTPGGTTLTASIEVPPEHGEVWANADGGFRYVPEEAFLGTDTFTFRVTNTDGDYAVGTVTMRVTEKPLLTVIAPDITVTYGDAVPVPEPHYTGFWGEDDVDMLEGQARCTADPASGTTSCSGATSSYYQFEYVDGVFTVAPAMLTVTASNEAVITGEPVPTPTPLYAGLVDGDLAPAIPPTCTADPATGTTSCSGADDPNYDISYVDGVLTVHPPIEVTSTTLPVATVGVAYRAQLGATGGDGQPFVWSLPDAGLPPGLSLAADGTISGIPTTAGQYRFTVVVGDPVEATITLVVQPGAADAEPPPTTGESTAPPVAGDGELPPSPGESEPPLNDDEGELLPETGAPPLGVAVLPLGLGSAVLGAALITRTARRHEH